MTFDIVPVAITGYRPDRDNWRQLPEAESEVRRIGAIFEQLGGRFLAWETDPGQRDLGQVTARLHEWAGSNRGRNSVLLWVGHGVSDDTAGLIVPVGDVNHPMRPEEFAARIIDRQRRRAEGQWAIIVVEACGAERFVSLVGAILLRERASDGVLIVGSGADQGSGYLGTFHAALSRVYAGYTGNDTRITLADLGNRLAGALPQGHVFPVPDRIIASAVLVPPRGPMASVTTSVDVYRELRDVLAKLSDEERIHFAGKGMGLHLGELGWYFVGRETERAAVIGRLADRNHGLLVLTGPRGTGKSAILGNVLLHARPEIRAILAGAGLVDDGSADAPPPIDLALLLTGATLPEVTGRIAELAGIELRGGVTAGESATELARQLRSRAGRPLVVLADGLDEARDPMPMAGLFRELSSIEGVTIVVGTRPAPIGPDGDTFTEDETLLAELGRRADHVTIQWVGRDPSAIATYVSRRLRAADGLRARLGDQLDDAIAVVIAALGDTGGREFLDAHLAVHELIADETLLLPLHRGRLDRVLRMSTEELFAHALSRMIRALPVSRAVLGVLAHARGRGVPRADGLWVDLAGVLAGHAVSEQDLDGVLQLAGPYIMLDAADEQSVYRFAHRELLRQYMIEPGHAELAASLARRLLGIAGEAADPGPYLRSHLSGHLADLGSEGWQALEGQPTVLDRLDISALVSDGMRSPGGPARLPSAIRGAFMSAHLASVACPADRPGLRQLGQAQVDGFRSGSAGGDDAEGGAWELRWARVRRRTPQVILAGHAGAVRALTGYAGFGNRLLLASAGDDCAIRLWDPVAAQAVRSDLARFTDPILALAELPQSDRTVRLVAVGSNDPVRMIDPRGRASEVVLPDRGGTDRGVAVLPGTSEARVVLVGVRELSVWNSDGSCVRSAPHRHAGWVEAITVVAGRAGPLIVTAGPDGQIRSWNPDLAPLVSWRTTPVRAIAVLCRDGAPDLVATGGDDGVIRCWDPVDGRRVGPQFTGHTEAVTALAAHSLPSGGVLLVSGSADKIVRAWWWFEDAAEAVDAADVCAHQVLIGHTGAVTAVTVFAGDNDEIRLASGARDGTVRLWTPQRDGGGRAEGDIPPGGPVSVLTAMVAADRTPILVVGMRDGTVHRWKAESGEIVTTTTLSDDSMASVGRSRGRRGQRRASIRAALEFTDADGRTVVVEAGQDGAVRLYADTGRRCGGPLTGHSDWATALAVAVDPSGRRILLTGDDNAVRLWCAGKLLPALMIPLGMRVRSIVQVGGDIAVSTDEGVLVLRPRWDLIGPEWRGERWSGDR
ncbi:AAA family ATPase [Nocardia sp. alder85J]|uniref:AAA family ATPase n=1 Tax=Nocardia sp. alder85J TaxID=2862949 RepID=UPI001CD25F20|nr:AAA family ATPase [Nocardia sp. alder85J]MCX4094964.1 hypothetical protein [Nocardia sp. alder85J]